MKTFSGTFNGQKYMGVESPWDSWDLLSNDPEWEKVVKEKYDSYELLGTYHTKGEIYFEVDENWVDDNGLGCYLDYVNQVPDNRYTLLTAENSLLSLLDRDSRMAFPLGENPYGSCPQKNDDEFNTKSIFYAATYQIKLGKWREAESQVRPKSFLIILVK